MSSRRSSLIVIALSAAFLFYKYILQNFPSVMAPQLMAAFDLQGLGLGILSGVYFWTYLIVPLFVGVILDRFGVRFVCGAAILSCAIGMFIFAKTSHLDYAIWSRALVGVGVSFATVAYLKLASVLFDKKYYALLTSFLVFSGMIGAVCGQMPLAWLMQQYGWRESLNILAIIGVVLAILYFIFVQDPVEDHEGRSQENIWKDIIQIFASKQNWLLTAYSGLAFSPVVIFCGLWGNPFLQTAFHLDKLTAPSMISMVFLGLALASPVYAKWSEHVKHRLNFMIYNTLLSALCLSLVLFIQPMSTTCIAILLFLFGFTLGAFPLVFVIGKESNPIYLAGTAISLINASDALFDAIIEPGVGQMLDLLNQGDSFSVFSYQLSLSILPLMQIVGALLLKWVKDPAYIPAN
jgi:predicted MFS family arabinose efflux permease